MGKTATQIAAVVSQHELAAIDEIFEDFILCSIEYDPVITNSYEYLPAGTYYRLEKAGLTG